MGMVCQLSVDGSQAFEHLGVQQKGRTFSFPYHDFVGKKYHDFVGNPDLISGPRFALKLMMKFWIDYDDLIATSLGIIG